MKSGFVLLVAVSCFTRVLAQEPDFTPELADSIKNSTLHFACGNSITWDTSKLAEAFRPVWDFNPIVFSQHYDDNSSVMAMVSHGWVAEGRSTTTTVTHSFIGLYAPNGFDRKGNRKRTLIYRIELFQSFRAGCFNLTLAQMGVYLKCMNQYLKDREGLGSFEEVHIKGRNEILKNDTLYIPKNCLISFNKFTGAEEPYKNDMFEDYPYPHRVCDEYELYRIFFTEKRGLIT